MNFKKHNDKNFNTASAKFKFTHFNAYVIQHGGFTHIKSFTCSQNLNILKINQPSNFFKKLN